MAARFAVSALCLLGTVSAQYTNGTASSSTASMSGTGSVGSSSSLAASAAAASTLASGNSTSAVASTTSSSAAAATTSAADDSYVTVNGVTFYVQTDTTYNGNTLSLTKRFMRRATATGLTGCEETCSTYSSCVATSYDSNTTTCAYYSSIDAASEATDYGTDFATVVSSSNSTSSSAATSGYSNSTMASSVPSATGYSNTTTSAQASSTAASSASASAVATAAPVTVDEFLLVIDGVEFFVEVNITYSGIEIDIDIMRKRADEDLDNCLATCAETTACAGTAFNANTSSCTYFSEIDVDSRATSNGTTFGTVVYRSSNSTTAASNTTAESLICPAYNGHVITSDFNVTFAVGCGEALVGTTLDIVLSKKRQSTTTGLPTTLSSCIDVCSATDACVGTTFDDATGTCTYYSEVAYAVVSDGMDSATRVDEGAVSAAGSTVTVLVPTTVTSTVVIAGSTSVGSGVITTTVTEVLATASTAPGTAAGSGSSSATITATVYTTSVVTAGSDYPAGATVTTVVPVGTTTYVSAAPTSANVVTVTVAMATSTAYADAISTATVTQYVSYCPETTTTDITYTTVYV